MNRRKVAISYCYVWMTEGYEKRAKMFKNYVSGYVKNTNPGWELEKIEGMKAIIVKK